MDKILLKRLRKFFISPKSVNDQKKPAKIKLFKMSRVHLFFLSDKHHCKTAKTTKHKNCMGNVFPLLLWSQLRISLFFKKNRMRSFLEALSVFFFFQCCESKDTPTDKPARRVQWVSRGTVSGGGGERTGLGQQRGEEGVEQLLPHVEKRVLQPLHLREVTCRLTA